ncbi:hypothetical protein B0H13DRAFT_2173146 [Mycena leptocephala]|nr:hypothetical protein B0H13DRAFT_2173146 [Mycena leptocephala]
MAVPNAPTTIEFTHSIHPDNAAYFNMLAPSSKDIRTARSHAETICTTCLKSEKDLGRQLRKCGKCHIVWYCSKECQTLNWPQHKPTCGEAGIPKLIKTFVSNGFLQIILQACFILDFNLLHRPRFDEPLMARVDVAIEPSDILDLTAILFGEEPFEKKIQGMLQVTGFTPATPLQIKNLTPTRREIWRQARAEAKSEGFPTDPVVLIEIAYADSGNSITFSLRIHSKAKEMVKRAKVEGFKRISAVTGETTTVPYTVETCMEFINTHIRADKKNQLLLRTEMRPSDIQVIRDVVANSDNVPARAMNEKLARENIYNSMYETLLARKRAVAAGIGR